MSIRDKTTVDAERPRVSRPTGSTAVHDREGVATDPRDLVRFSIPEFEYRPLGGAPTLRWPHSGWIAHPLPAGELTPANMIMLEFIHALSTASLPATTADCVIFGNSSDRRQWTHSCSLPLLRMTRG
jgi:hypothetical protein